ncbi:MAG: dihydropteroate synthase, partial [Bdellovibrionales bacterium]|nr:dihydropteroate synthase [Bdellovibrionales bacterium]
ELLKMLKEIESDLGREPGPRWSPRLIDLDLLIFGDLELKEDRLILPHPQMTQRSFVLGPLKDLSPHLVVPGTHATALALSRKLPTHSPLVMGIMNLTPDSFSDGGQINTDRAFSERVEKMEKAGVHLIDLGAESTRPGASLVPPEEEWLRLERPLKSIRALFKYHWSRPLISVDTRNAVTAAKALREGADWINDVSGLGDPEMISVLQSSSCSFVIMHHLGIPADPKTILSAALDPVEELKLWLRQKLEILDHHGIDLDRVVFDPGIGFGKSPHQSIAILKRSSEFRDLSVRFLIGHSRKSFMKVWGQNHPLERDVATLGASLGLLSQGVDILRVHNPEDHLTALHARLELI